MKKQILPVILVLIIVVLCWRSCSNNNKLKQQVSLYNVAQDSLLQSRNKLNQQISKIGIFAANNKKYFLQLKTRDSTIIALQKVVKNYKGKLISATVINNNTTDNGTSNTIIKYDTVKTDTGTYISPIYTSNWKEQWSIGSITASKDSIIRKIKIINKFEITQGFEKQGFLKKRKSVVTIKNLNPNTVTTELRTFTIKTKTKKLSLGIGIAYGISINTFKPTIVIGPTLHIPIISF